MYRKFELLFLYAWVRVLFAEIIGRYNDVKEMRYKGVFQKMIEI